MDREHQVQALDLVYKVVIALRASKVGFNEVDPQVFFSHPSLSDWLPQAQKLIDELSEFRDAYHV
jgi:hypothetical protein